MDYYSTLGLRRGASEDEIKKAYRSMAMKFHPDRGGDEKKFKEIEEAYRFLSDPEKKNIIDMGGDPNRNAGHAGGFHGQGPFEFHFGSGNFEDIFGQFGFGFQNQRNMRRNKSFNINIDMSLEEVLVGKEINAEIGVPGGKNKIVNINVPAGIENGQQIRYQGMGDDTYKDSRPGDLLVNIIIKPHKTFRREGDNIVCEKNINVWDAMLGCNLQIDTLDNKKIDIMIPPGTQPDTVLGCKGEGIPNVRTRIKGSLLIKIKVSIPKMLSENQKQLIRSIKNGI